MAFHKTLSSLFKLMTETEWTAEKNCRATHFQFVQKQMNFTQRTAVISFDSFFASKLQHFLPHFSNSNSKCKFFLHIFSQVFFVTWGWSKKKMLFENKLWNTIKINLPCWKEKWDSVGFYRNDSTTSALLYSLNEFLRATHSAHGFIGIQRFL